MIRSPLKWAGSKAKLAARILPHFPRAFRRYHELFFGGGSMYFAAAVPPMRAHLSDASPQLIRTWRVIRDDVEALIDELSRADRYLYNEAAYGDIRARLNAGVATDVELAAAFVYINRCGFNGLWRVNGMGLCNVPIGDYKAPTICDPETLRGASSALRDAEISCGDFAERESLIEPGDLVYIDSPYVPQPGKASFVGYTKEGFTAADHVRLADMVRRLAERGVYCVASNSDTPDTRALYRGFEIVSLDRSGSINSKASERGRVGEVLILGGQWEKRGEVRSEAAACL